MPHAVTARFGANVTAVPLNGWSESDQAAIREQLDRILKSRPFQPSRRRQRFLDYIVNETLAGRGERLKGYNIAIEVFDRAETFDLWSIPSCASRRRGCATSCANITSPTARTTASASICPRARTRPHIEFRRPATPRSQPDRSLGAVAPQPGSRKTNLASPGGIHDCSFACAVCGFRCLAVVDSIRAIIRESLYCGPAVREHWKRSQMGTLCRRGYRGHRHRPVSLEGSVCRRSKFHAGLQGQARRRKTRWPRSRRTLRARRQHSAERRPDSRDRSA